MTVFNPGIKGFAAGEDLVAGRRVKIHSAGVVKYAGDEAGIGFTLYPAKLGEHVSVQTANYNGTVLLEAAGVVSLGADVVCAASGKIAATGSHRIVGIALEAATAAGDLIEILPVGAGPIKKTVMAVYDFAVNGGTTGAKALGVILPNKAVVTGGFVDVLTTLTSADDSATVALHIQTANDLVTAVAIDDGADPWDSGRRSVIPAGTGATAIKCTAAREITATIGVQALTAGKFVICLDYVVSL